MVYKKCRCGKKYGCVRNPTGEFRGLRSTTCSENCAAIQKATKQMVRRYKRRAEKFSQAKLSQG